MKKLFRGLLITVFALVILLPNVVNAKDNKVKVYVFEAGGCPYCEKEIEYLKGLKSYNKKFVIVRKEMYVDHINWEQGKDYELGRIVANSFYNAGFEGASYQGTPFVVISDIYAATTYTDQLESVIEDAYKKGDKDVVTCLSKGKDDCAIAYNDNDPVNEDLSSDDSVVTSSTSNIGSPLVIIICTAVLIIVYLIKSTYDQKKLAYALSLDSENCSCGCSCNHGNKCDCDEECECGCNAPKKEVKKNIKNKRK